MPEFGMFFQNHHMYVVILSNSLPNPSFCQIPYQIRHFVKFLTKFFIFWNSLPNSSFCQFPYQILYQIPYQFPYQISLPKSLPISLPNFLTNFLTKFLTNFLTKFPYQFLLTKFLENPQMRLWNETICCFFSDDRQFFPYQIPYQNPYQFPYQNP